MEGTEIAKTGAPSLSLPSDGARRRDDDFQSSHLTPALSTSVGIPAGQQNWKSDLIIVQRIRQPILVARALILTSMASSPSAPSAESYIAFCLAHNLPAPSSPHPPDAQELLLLTFAVSGWLASASDAARTRYSRGQAAADLDASRRILLETIKSLDRRVDTYETSELLVSRIDYGPSLALLHSSWTRPSNSPRIPGSRPREDTPPTTARRSRSCREGRSRIRRVRRSSCLSARPLVQGGVYALG